jgi:hypothetical protein
MRNVPGDITNELQLKAAKWLFEAAYGKRVIDGVVRGRDYSTFRR